MMAPVVERTCSVEGCLRPAADGCALCRAHEKRRQRGQPLSAPVRDWGLSPQDALRKAALRYADASDDEEYRRADALLLEVARQLSRRPYRCPKCRTRGAG